MRNHLSFIVCASVAGGLLMAGETWQDKAPADWSDKDVQQILEHSPWVRYASATFNERMSGGPGSAGSMDPSAGGGGPMGGGGGMGPGGGGGGMGPGGGGGGPMGPGGQGGPGGMQLPTFTVRWASAQPVREALTKSGTGGGIAEWAADFIVITMDSPKSMRPPGMQQEQSPEADAARAKRMSAGLKEATALKVKGRDAVHPARVELIQTEDGQVFAFLFPRSEGISANDKDVTFETALGPMQIKSKFNVSR